MHGTFIQEPFGPTHPDLGAGVAKYRRKAMKAGSVMEMDRAERHAYADAIEKAIRAKHRTLHMKPTPAVTPNWYKPPSITRLLRYTVPMPMAGDPECGDRYAGNAWQRRERVLYAAAMAAKRAAQAKGA